MKAEELSRPNFNKTTNTGFRSVTCVGTSALGTVKDEYRRTSLSRPDDVRMGVFYAINQVMAHLVKLLPAGYAIKCLCYTVFATIKGLICADTFPPFTDNLTSHKT